MISPQCIIGSKHTRAISECSLAIGEGSTGPHQIGRFAVLATVFVGLECSGILLGYAFLAKPLGLFRQE
jgi:hypothetical protein